MQLNLMMTKVTNTTGQLRYCTEDAKKTTSVTSVQPMRLHLNVMVPNEVQIMTVEFAVDLDSNLCNETPKKWRKVE
jgi:hypothetical protein